LSSFTPWVEFVALFLFRKSLPQLQGSVKKVGAVSWLGLDSESADPAFLHREAA